MRNYENMQIGQLYTITKGSADNTLLKGDHVYKHDNGDLSCIEAGGWLDKATAERVAKKVELELDMSHINGRRAQLQAELAELQEVERTHAQADTLQPS